MLVPVYDIIECGPRNRFMANGKIVHNSGGFNVQNLTRNSPLRAAIKAPEGYTLAVCDYSAIEARILAWFAGQEDVVNLFKAGEDVYCDMATKVYGRPITKKDKKERQLGKTLVLGAGYQIGWRRFQEAVTDMSKILFTAEDAETFGVSIASFCGSSYNAKFLRAACPSYMDTMTFAAHCAVSEYLIDTYRTNNHKIKALWGEAAEALAYIYEGEVVSVGAVPGLVTTSRRGFEMPGGRAVKYFGLEKHQKGRKVNWTRMTRDGIGSVHGGLAVENLTQALARHIMADQKQQLANEGYHVVMSCHDEIVLCERDYNAQEALDRMIQVMSSPPKWAATAPIGCEGSLGKTYGEAK